MSEAKSNTLRRLVGRSRGPKSLKGCKTCKWWNPHSEAYACEVCDEKLAREKREGL